MPKHDHTAHEGHHQEPLLFGQGSFPLFNDGKRTRNDVKWAIAYLTVVALTIAGGVALFFFGSPDFLKQVSPDHLADPASCPVDQPSLRRRGLLAEPEQKGATLTALFAHPFSTIGCTLAGSGFLGFLFIVGFRHQASAMIALALGLQLGTTALLAVGLGLAGNVMGAGFVGLYFLLLVWLYWLWKDQIALVGRLLSIAGHALVENSGLLGIGLAMPVVWGLSLIPTAAFGVIAVTNGQVVPNPNSVGLRHGGDGSPQCVDDQGGPVMCCTWEVDAPAKAYLGLLGLTFTWSTLLLSQIKLFAVAGAVAQWYFTPANPRRSRVLFSLGHALGPSFGSLCAASALLTLISYLRQALDVAEQQARKENQAVAIIAAIVAAILRFILSLVEFMTRFTTVRMAITGEPFIPAAKASVSLFKRNAMNAFGVWWLPPFILGNCMLVLSAVFGVLVWGSASLIYRPADNDVSTVVMGATAGVVALVVLSFLQGLLMDVVETVFVCFAMDRDTHNVTRHEVHVILKEVPSVGQVVEQPDGDIAYGAPTSGPGRV